MGEQVSVVQRLDIYFAISFPDTLISLVKAAPILRAPLPVYKPTQNPL